MAKSGLISLVNDHILKCHTKNSIQTTNGQHTIIYSFNYTSLQTMSPTSLEKQFALQPILSTQKNQQKTIRFRLEMQRKFKERGYKNDQINIAIEKILNKTRHDLFQGQSRKKTHSCVLTTRYSKCSVHKHWHILKSDDSLGNVFSNLPLVVFSRGRNSRDQIVNKGFTPENNA